MSCSDNVTAAAGKSRPADFLPAASLEMLRLRAELLAEVRRFFDARGFWEVETPLLSHDVVVDAWLEPFTTRWTAGGPAARDDSACTGTDGLFLQTSPEFGMKRLLCAGATAIYQITRAMRNGEFGRYHNPEFTMIEWYRVGETHHGQMELAEELVAAVIERAAGCGRSPDRATETDRRSPSSSGDLLSQNRRGHRPAPNVALPTRCERPFDRLTYDEAFERYAGTKVLKLSTPQLADVARSRGIEPPPGLPADDRDGWLNLLLAELVEPHLGRERGQFLYDYPASQAALARIRDDDPPVAERFELYLDGIEICNGYHELTDARELRERMRTQAAIREKEGRRRLPQRSRLLDAMEAGLPDCAGVALGFDRLVMYAVGARSLAEVIAFPFDRA
ncbi:MAG: EF-P lysine aminoacylase EpmA [Planctomycetota bacterium]